MTIGRALTVTVLAAGVVAIGAAARSADSTKIAPWSRIGDAGLNTSRASLVARYGPFTGSLKVVKPAEGGELDVTVARNVVVNVSTDSPRYRTPDGIHVGVKTPATSHWKGFTFNRNFQAWERVVCFEGIHTVVDLATEKRVIRQIAAGFLAGVCPGLTPRQPLTAADKAAMTAVAKKAGKPATIELGHYKVAIDSKEWASAIITGKDQHGYALQSSLAVFHHGTAWTLVDVGTDSVGCTKVPIEPLTQIGSDCPG